MNPEVKTLWVNALRSGNYKQGHGTLHQIKPENEYLCCLGVLCVLARDAGVARQVTQDVPENWPEGTPFVPGEHWYASVHIYDTADPHWLPLEVLEWSGMTSKRGDEVIIDDRVRELSFHNDRGTLFTVIADAIESQL